MAFEGRLRLPHPAETLGAYLPTLDIWLRLNPQWSLLSLKPTGEAGAFDLRLRLDQDESEANYIARISPLNEGRGWRLDLVRDGSARSVDLELAAVGQACELVLRDASIADNDGALRTTLALWLRATADYMLLSASHRWRARLGKWLLDRIWLRMNLTGRRVAILILAYEAVGFVFLIAWLIWERFAG